MRYPGLTLRILGGAQPAMGPGQAALLERIAASGSISAAARDMGMSYRRAWQLVEAINASFAEPVVVTATGGKRGGGASVTPFGRDLVARFHAMEDKASAAIADDLAQFKVQLATRRMPPARKPAVRRKTR
jgi:molybdate transport system regulatory protein